MSSNRGQTETLTYLNYPNAVADVSGSSGIFYARPDPATLAPIFSPQVPIVHAGQVTPPVVFVQPPPHSSGRNDHVTTVVLSTLAIVLVMWLAKIMFSKR